MKSLILSFPKLFGFFVKKSQAYVPTGRWKIDYCTKKINHKIDLSNEDHCGPCGQYAINKINNEKIKKNN